MSSERQTLTATLPASTPVEDVAAVERTYVGIDIGEKTLATVAPAGATPDEAVAVGDEGVIRGYWNHLSKTTARLDETPGVPTSAEAAVLASDWPLIRDRLFEVVDRVLDVVESYPRPVLVREALDRRATAAWCYRHSRELGAWLIPALLEAIDSEAAARGVDVIGADPFRSSRVCYRCLSDGYLDRRTFACGNDECDVGIIDRDENAALVLADRGRFGHRRHFYEENHA
ncbi:zinc ribbon domain-containing protein [Halorubrum tropicale]|uniref:Cas12f1-like TNB domain-containing protein n=1 Tax=Halorubrum tropicale TaxID=1765655 RepID=A0A0M9AL60_9EURY|nr:zinc ribbon domain-containing protein [Halorubrum tropicale]KOX94222.1 hypothetical protein AMR74_16050 [Halorubrum tropicale]